MQQRLLHKRRVRASALASADAGTRLAEVLADLRRHPSHVRHPARAHGTGNQCTARIAVATGERCAFLALLTSAGVPPLLVSGAFRHGRWRVSTSARQVLHTVHAALEAPATVRPPCGDTVRIGERQAAFTARCVLRRWIRARRSRTLVHGDASLPEPVLRSARRVLDSWVITQPLANRAQAYERAAQVLRALHALRGSGAEQAIRRALADANPDGRVSALEALANLPASRTAHPATGAPLCLSALVILRPASGDPAPPTTSSESAATR